MRSHSLKGIGFHFGVMKMSWNWIVVRIAQLCACNKWHWIVPFKTVSECMGLREVCVGSLFLMFSSWPQWRVTDSWHFEKPLALVMTARSERSSKEGPGKQLGYLRSWRLCSYEIFTDGSAGDDLGPFNFTFLQTFKGSGFYTGIIKKICLYPVVLRRHQANDLVAFRFPWGVLGSFIWIMPSEVLFWNTFALTAHSRGTSALFVSSKEHKT